MTGREAMKKGLLDFVRDEGLLDAEALARAAGQAQRRGVALAIALVEDGGLSEARLVDALERRLGIPRVDPHSVTVDIEAVRELAYGLAVTHLVLPMSIERKEGRRVLRLALADPLDGDAIEEIETSTACRVEPALAPPSALASAIERAYRGMVTQLIPRGRRGAAAPASDGSPMEGGATQPQARIEDAAPVEVRLRALVQLLVDKGVLAEGEYEKAVRRQLRGSDEE